MSDLAGFGRLCRLAVRRDRVAVPLWMVGMAGFTAATTFAWRFSRR